MSRRSLSTRERLRLFEAHDGVCHICGGKIDGTRERWEISHDQPSELGGADDDKNRKPAHYKCHRHQTSTKDIPNIAKAKRRQAKHLGAYRKKGQPMDGTKASRYRKRMDGRVERRS